MIVLRDDANNTMVSSISSINAASNSNKETETETETVAGPSATQEACPWRSPTADNDGDDLVTTPVTAASQREKIEYDASIQPAVAQFHRSEIELGEQIGEGYFSKVYEINAFQLITLSVGSSTSPGSSTTTPPEHDEEEIAARKQCHNSARRPNGEARYVLKHLHPRLLESSNINSNSDNNRKDFENGVIDLVAEAKYLQQLNHPHILSLQGVTKGGPSAYRGGSYDSYFIITERLSETLAQRIHRWKKQQGPTTTTELSVLEQKCKYALQMGQALEYLHAQRMVYRDLKPANAGFACDDVNKIKIFDFGLCCRLPDTPAATCGDVFAMSGGVGTRRYSAFEVCRNEPYNEKVDVYSLAMVLWEMLTLEKPFGKFSIADHQQFVCQLGGTPNLKPWVGILPANLHGLLRNMWARSIPKRWTMTQVCEGLQDVIVSLHQDQQQQQLQLDEASTIDAYQKSHTSSSSNGKGQRGLPVRRRSKIMDRKDAMVNLGEERNSSSGMLSARA